MQDRREYVPLGTSLIDRILSAHDAEATRYPSDHATIVESASIGYAVSLHDDPRSIENPELVYRPIRFKVWRRNEVAL